MSKHPNSSAESAGLTNIERVRLALAMADAGYEWDVELEYVEALLKAYDDIHTPAQRPEVSIQPMALSDGRTDYFVQIKVGARAVTPHVFREEFKAAYHVELYDWLLNGTGEEPDCVEFGPDDWPARVQRSSAATGGERERIARIIDPLPWRRRDAGHPHDLDAGIIHQSLVKADAIIRTEPQAAPVPQSAAALAERLIQAAVDYESGRCSKRELAEARGAVETAIKPSQGDAK